MPGRLIRSSDGAVLAFDAVVSESYTPTVTLTDHPVEDGATVTDHAIRAPNALALQAMVTETPFARAGGVGGVQRTADARQFLTECIGVELSYESVKYGTIDHLLLERYAHQVTASGSLLFDIGLKEVRFAEVGYVTIPPSAPKAEAAVGTPDEQDVGVQPTEDESVLHWLTGGAPDTSAATTEAQNAEIKSRFAKTLAAVRGA